MLVHVVPELDLEVQNRCVGRIGRTEQRSEALLEMRDAVSKRTINRGPYYAPGCPLPKLSLVRFPR
jgi:hypothetical protein